MTLVSGTRLGPYEIQSLLGQGGMGEVYRARDTRLERDVAVKVLPAKLSSDSNLRQRLEREAKAVSKLSHPHICTLHDIGRQDGVDFLVMELVEGETLEQRLLKGPLPVEQTIRLGAQIADSLAKAHRLGITHRDLKPANVMLTKSGVKLMDFGLAKQSETAPLADALTEISAVPSKLTSEGAILGTFQYMAPEQLEGKDADARTDIFALGELLYEMATGKPAFGGRSRASLIAAILTNDPPPISQLQPLAPVALERIIRKCLAKDPDERWQSASDLAAELNWIAESDSQVRQASAGPIARSWKLRASWLLTGLFLLGMIVTGFAWWQATTKHPRSMYFHAAVPFSTNDAVLAPDGKLVVLVAYSSEMNDYALWTYEVGGRRKTLLDGTQGASYPFWSPDSKMIAFFADGKLKRIEVEGGQIRILCDAPSGRGGTWNRNGDIVANPRALGPLVRIPASGGSPVQVTNLDVSRFETSHRWPVFLPDGKHFLYLAANFGGRYEYNAIFVGSLDGNEKPHKVVSASSNVAFANPGFLIYVRDEAVVAQSFEMRGYELRGEPHTLSNRVSYFPQTDRALFSANDDLLITQAGKGASVSRLTWFNREGKAIGSIGVPGSHDNVRISPDGQKIATDKVDPDGRNVDIWVHEPGRNLSTRLTFDPSLDQVPIWSPDGKRILFGSNRLPKVLQANSKLGFHIYLKNADGSGGEEELFDPDAGLASVWDWSRDGRYMVYKRDDEVWYLTLPDHIAKPLFQGTGTVRNGQFSPDGRWIAYSSSESGQTEVYVSPFPSLSNKWQISSAGGSEPRWKADGKELFYLSAEGKMMSVPVGKGANFEAGQPVALFETHRRQPMSVLDFFSYDVSPDGQKFLLATKVDEDTTAPLGILMNWESEMTK